MTGNAFAVADTAIRCADSSFQRIDQFAFKKVFRSSNEFAPGAFNSVVAPLVRGALAGDSTMCVIGGPASFNIHKYLVSQQGMQGFLSATANMILQSVHEEAHATTKQKTVTLSWYRVDCTERETIVDICDGHAKEVVFRELGNGRGLAPYDLAEIEITSGNEVDVLVKAVLDNVAHANHTSGDAHSVIQFKITPRQSSKHSTLRSGAGKLLDSVGTGRLSFVMLSDTSSQKQLLSADANIGTFPWVDKIPTVMDWLDSKRATPPFRNSRLLLLLRDALYGRQQSSFLLLLHPTLEYLQSNYNWLQLSQRLCKETLHNHLQVTSMAGPALAGSAVASPSAATVGSFNSVKLEPHDISLSLKKPPPPPPPPSSSLPSSSINGSKHGPAKDRYQVLTERTSRVSQQPNPSHPASNQSATGKINAANRSIGMLSTQDQPESRSDSDEDDDILGNNPFGAPSTNSGDKLSVSDDMSSSRMDIRHINSSEPINDDVDDVGAILSELNAELGGRSMAANRRTLITKAKPPASTTIMSSSSAYQSPSSSSKSPFSSQYPAPLSAISNGANHKYSESEMILAASLDVSRRECETLRQKLSESIEKLTLCQSAYDSLVIQLREEGSLLMKKEQDRFKKCMQDLRDYEVYKRVMEAAMVRMQKEVENLKAENESIRVSKESFEFAVRKQKSAVFKSSKEVVQSSDKIRDLEQLTSKLELDVR